MAERGSRYQVGVRTSGNETFMGPASGTSPGYWAPAGEPSSRNDWGWSPVRHNQGNRRPHPSPQSWSWSSGSPYCIPPSLNQSTERQQQWSWSPTLHLPDFQQRGKWSGYDSQNAPCSSPFESMNPACNSPVNGERHDFSRAAPGPMKRPRQNFRQRPVFDPRFKWTRKKDSSPLHSDGSTCPNFLKGLKSTDTSHKCKDSSCKTEMQSSTNNISEKRLGEEKQSNCFTDNGKDSEVPPSQAVDLENKYGSNKVPGSVEEQRKSPPIESPCPSPPPQIQTLNKLSSSVERSESTVKSVNGDNLIQHSSTESETEQVLSIAIGSKDNDSLQSTTLDNEICHVAKESLQVYYESDQSMSSMDGDTLDLEVTSEEEAHAASDIEKSERQDIFVAENDHVICNDSISLNNACQIALSPQSMSGEEPLEVECIQEIIASTDIEESQKYDILVRDTDGLIYNDSVKLNAAIQRAISPETVFSEEQHCLSQLEVQKLQNFNPSTDIEESQMYNILVAETHQLIFNDSVNVNTAIQRAISPDTVAYEEQVSLSKLEITKAQKAKALKSIEESQKHKITVTESGDIIFKDSLPLNTARQMTLSPQTISSEEPLSPPQFEAQETNASTDIENTQMHEILVTETDHLICDDSVSLNNALQKTLSPETVTDAEQDIDIPCVVREDDHHYTGTSNELPTMYFNSPQEMSDQGVCVFKEAVRSAVNEENSGSSQVSYTNNVTETIQATVNDSASVENTPDTPPCISTTSYHDIKDNKQSQSSSKIKYFSEISQSKQEVNVELNASKKLNKCLDKKKNTDFKQHDSSVLINETNQTSFNQVSEENVTPRSDGKESEDQEVHKASPGNTGSDPDHVSNDLPSTSINQPKGEQWAVEVTAECTEDISIVIKKRGLNDTCDRKSLRKKKLRLSNPAVDEPMDTSEENIDYQMHKHSIISSEPLVVKQEPKEESKVKTTKKRKKSIEKVKEEKVNPPEEEAISLEDINAYTKLFLTQGASKRGHRARMETRSTTHRLAIRTPNRALDYITSRRDEVFKAAEDGLVERIRELVQDTGAALRSPTTRQTLLHAAAAKGQVDVVVLLLPLISPTTVDVQGRTPVHLAALGGHTQVLRLLTADPDFDHSVADNNGSSYKNLLCRSLSRAVVEDNISRVQELLRLGADPGDTDPEPVDSDDNDGTKTNTSPALHTTSPRQLAHILGRKEVEQVFLKMSPTKKEDNNSSLTVAESLHTLAQEWGTEKGKVGVDEVSESDARGFVCILGYSHFKGRPHLHLGGVRSGAHNLADVFCDMGYSGTAHFDLTADQTKEELLRVRDVEVLDKANCAVFFVSSHATPDSNFLTSDRKLLSFDWLYSMFQESVCPRLKGKPKLFIFDLCYGLCSGEGGKDGIRAQDARVREPLQDTVAIYSSCGGGVTWYSFSEGGSLFTTSLCDTLRQLDRKAQLHDFYRELVKRCTADDPTAAPQLLNIAFTKELFLNQRDVVE